MTYEARHVRECLRKGKDLGDSGVRKWQGKGSGKGGRPLPTPQPFKQLFRSTSPRTSWVTICLNVLPCLEGFWEL